MRILVSLLFVFLLPGSAAADRLPNIVLLVADDLGWTDLACYGSGYYQSPHIDQLAAEGMKFTDAYAYANCAPTRACLMTGQNTPRHGMYTVSTGARGKERDRKVIPVENIQSLDPSTPTLGTLFKSVGYVTAHVGKWHLGTPGQSGPLELGFDYNIGGFRGGMPKTYFAPYENAHLPDGPEGENLTDRLAEEAVKIIRQHRDEQFFLYLPFYAVHVPLEAKEPLIEKYKQREPVGGHHNSTYAAMIETLDAAVGRVLQTLDELQLADETLVIFISDNGGLGGYASMGLPHSRNITDNAPLKGGKGSFYEGGIRVPMIVRWPGVIAPGTECDVPVSVLDFFPTLATVADADTPTDHPLDGTDIVPLWRGDSIEDRALFWHFPGYLEAYGPEKWRTTPVSVIRDGRYKLLEFLEDGRLELYDLQEDLGEWNDLADEVPHTASKLLTKLRNWRDAVGAPLPQR